MSTTHERVDGVVDAGLNPLRAILVRPRQAFVAEGPPSVAVPRHRIVRLLALVLDNADVAHNRGCDLASRPVATPPPDSCRPIRASLERGFAWRPAAPVSRPKANR